MDIGTVILLISIGWMAHVIFAQYRTEKRRKATVADSKAQKPLRKRIPNDFPFDSNRSYRFDD